MAEIARRRRFSRLRRRLEMLENEGLKSAPPAVCACGPVRLALGALHELRAADWRDAPAAQGLALALAGRIAAAAGKPVVWIGQGRDAFLGGRAYAHGLSAFGVNPDETIFVYPHTAQEILWAAEEATRSPDVAAVVVEFFAAHRLLDLTASRRLQLAAESSGATAILLRDARDEEPSAARTRWRIGAAPSAHDPYDFKASGAPRWRAVLERCREGGHGEWVLEWDSEKRELIKAAADPGAAGAKMADRPPETARAVA